MKMLEAMLPQLQQMTGQAVQQVVKQNGFSSEEAGRLAKMQEQIMALSMQSIRAMLPAVKRAYAEVYSEAELKAMKSFFSTPEGQAMLKKQPELMKKLGPTML